MRDGPVTPPGYHPESPAPAAAGRPRWYTHGWNRPISWELVLGITPWLPRILLSPARHVVSFACFVCMPRERAAARRNLARVTGRGGLGTLLLAYRLFHNFSRFMISYGGLGSFDPEAEPGRLLGVDETERIIRQVIDEGRGVVIVTMHVGHWDLGLRLLTRHGLPVHVVMLSEESDEVSRYANEARALPNLTVHRMGSSPLLAVELMTALKRGEIVAVQADRPVGGNVMPTRLFGAETPLPTGPAQLAMATGAPVLPLFVLFETGGRYQLLAMSPMRFERGRGDGAKAALAAAMKHVAGMMESVLSRYPDQWFNFYDVWPVARAGDDHE